MKESNLLRKIKLKKYWYFDRRVLRRFVLIKRMRGLKKTTRKCVPFNVMSNEYKQEIEKRLLSI